LDWHTAFGIIRGIAQGLAYIHAHHFIYVYLNAQDIVLDSDMIPKIYGFRFSEELDHGNPKATQKLEKINIG
jgi:serine/threonine protein kinase